MLHRNLRTHDASQCSGEHCCIHKPSNHHMKDWPMNWRADKGVMERICPHGVGHPDPDDAAHLRRTGRGSLTTHGCDGCCRPPSPLPPITPPLISQGDAITFNGQVGTVADVQHDNGMRNGRCVDFPSMELTITFP